MDSVKWQGPLRHAGRGARCAPVLAAGLVFVAMLGAASAARADASTGFVIVGPINASWSVGAGITIDVAAVENNSAKAQGLSLQLWAIPVADGLPTFSAIQDFEDLGGVGLGTIGAGKSITNIAHGGLTYTPPKAGCYYVTLALLNSSLHTVDLFTFSKGGTPAANGFDVFAFGNATCPAATSCSVSANTACLDGGRFQVAATYYNATSGKAQGQVLSFSGVRAESDESAFYYFTDPSNFEMGVKVLDACSVNNFFWVFLGGLTNQGWEVNVLDTATGHSKFYSNDLNITTVTTTDTTALPCP